MVALDLLAVVEERSPRQHHHRGEGRARAGRSTEAAHRRLVPRGLVVVGREPQPHAAGGHRPGIRDLALHPFAGRRPLPHRLELAVGVPAVGQVEPEAMHLEVAPFGEHQDRPIGGGPQRRHRLLPEGVGHEAGRIDPEAVDVVGVEPPLHRGDHRAPQRRVAVVELCDVGPVGQVPLVVARHREVALGVAHVVVGVLRRPDVVPRGVVGHPVDDDPHAPGVDRIDKRLEVRRGAEQRVHGMIVLHGVGRAEGALPFRDADRMDRHQPEDVGAGRRDAVEVGRHAAQVAAGREVAHEHLVDRALPDPRRIVRRAGRDGGRCGAVASDRDGGDGKQREEAAADHRELRWSEGGDRRILPRRGRTASPVRLAGTSPRPVC